MQYEKDKMYNNNNYSGKFTTDNLLNGYIVLCYKDNELIYRMYGRNENMAKKILNNWLRG